MTNIRMKICQVCICLSVCVFIPSRLWIVLAFWLGLGEGRKPEERPEVEEGERDGAALLLGVLRGLLEMEQPRAGSCLTESYVLTCQKTNLLNDEMLLENLILG